MANDERRRVGTRKIQNIVVVLVDKSGGQQKDVAHDLTKNQKSKLDYCLSKVKRPELPPAQ
jgi:hypothetical protein